MNKDMNEDLKQIEEEIKTIQTGTQATEENGMPALPVITPDNKPAPINTTETGLGFSDMGGAIDEAKQKIIGKAARKIQDDKIIEKHSENIAKISDRALEVDAERQRLIVEQVNADNKVIAQEIKNRLIVLKAEAKRLKKEQKQLDKDQKAAHKAKNKDAKWIIYGDKLKRMKYEYVPNIFVLKMLLFFDGIKSFFDGLGTVSTAIVKAFRWVLIGGAIIGVLMIVPITREWLLSLMKFK